MAVAVKKIAGIARASVKKVEKIYNVSKELFYSALINDANLQGYWRMEDNWNDSSPNGYNLTATNTPTFVTGKFGKAGNFVAASEQYATHSNPANCNVATSQTFLAVIKATSVTDYAILGFSGSALEARRRFLTQTSVLKFNADGLTPSVVSSGITLDTGIHFIAARYNSATGKLAIFVDGSKTEVDVTGSVTNSNSNFSIGKQGVYSGFSFDGWIDDVAIFDRALTDLEITNLYTTNIKKFAGVSNV